jgi:hypothetical protein
MLTRRPRWSLRLHPRYSWHRKSMARSGILRRCNLETEQNNGTQGPLGHVALQPLQEAALPALPGHHPAQRGARPTWRSTGPATYRGVTMYQLETNGRGVGRNDGLGSRRFAARHGAPMAPQGRQGSPQEPGLLLLHAAPRQAGVRAPAQADGSSQWITSQSLLTA